MRLRGLQSAILVSHPLHLYRARWLFQGQGLEVFTSPTNTELWRITPPARLWYTLREVGGVILVVLERLPAVVAGRGGNPALVLARPPGS
jgi:uncharacterized SAM-binding protein YcdF (DUF218 family)